MDNYSNITHFKVFFKETPLTAYNGSINNTSFYIKIYAYALNILFYTYLRIFYSVTNTYDRIIFW